MSIHNVTAQGFTHRCEGRDDAGRPICQKERALPLSHPDVIVTPFQTDQGVTHLLTVRCEDGHWECFKHDLPTWEETSPTRDEASREQVRNVRLLHKHLGLPTA